MSQLKVGLIGCGGISGAHMGGYRELWDRDFRLFDIVAAADVNIDAANTRAGEAQEIQGGNKPKAYDTVAEMLDKHPEIDCVDICTLHSEHHGLATQALQAGKHVIIEKPLGITMRAGKQIIDAATTNNRILSVAENYRLSRHERARRWAVQQGMIGDVRMFFWIDVGESLGKWGWRNFKMQAGGGWALDGGVHFTDLMRFHLGLEAKEVYAVNKAYEPFRYGDVKERSDGYEVDVEDCMISTITFDQGVSAQWTWVGSAPGQGFNRKTIYGSEGSLDWGSGLHQRNTGDLISTDEIYQKFMSSLSESEREYFFPRDIDNTIAIELKYFADAINSGSQPEVDGLEGYRSQAICMAVYESGYFGRSVTIEEIENLSLEGYQKEINNEIGVE
ncbi:hypothetical protein CMK18_00970 [Candidatus Poribacteria bacterium]|nr:hypothetical protein [Candidatus Poribacteria bacterium]